MKRFYKTATVVANGPGFGVALDGRPVKTPQRKPLVVPSRALAAAIAEEWNRQGDKLDHLTMPLTQLANTAIDRLPGLRTDAIGELCDFVATDALFFWAERPASLVERQAARCQPILDWAGRRFDALFLTTQGLTVPEQPARALEAIRAHLESMDDFRLAATQHAAGTARSCLIGLALAEAAIDSAAAFEACTVEEQHQLDQWGDDAEARDRLARIRADLEAAGTLFRLLDAD